MVILFLLGKIGSSTAGVLSSTFDGLISEVIVFNRALYDAEIKAINDYLSAKYFIN